jgi:hypothetical protein
LGRRPWENTVNSQTEVKRGSKARERKDPGADPLGSRDLDIKGSERVLEIGGGPGVAASIICERLETGSMHLIHRSGTPAERARRRNVEDVAAGQLTLETVDLRETLRDRCALRSWPERSSWRGSSLMLAGLLESVGEAPSAELPRGFGQLLDALAEAPEMQLAWRFG